MNVLLVPFPMAPVNTKNVHRTNFLLGHPYGTDFVYDEMMVAPGLGDIARTTTETFATMVSLLGTGGLTPGAGPTRGEREKGFYDILFLGELPDGGRVEAVVTGDRDPGYGSTSKMIAESALCLGRNVQGEGGIWTPGALMGPGLCASVCRSAPASPSTRVKNAQNCGTLQDYVDRSPRKRGLAFAGLLAGDVIVFCPMSNSPPGSANMEG